MGSFIEILPGRAQYETDEPNIVMELYGPMLGTGVADGGMFLTTLYLPTELRGVTPLTLRIMLATVEGAGYTDFDLFAYGSDEMTETFTGVASADDQRFTFTGAGSVVEGGTIWTAYKDFDISEALTASTSHVWIWIQRLEPLGGLTDNVAFLNARTLE